MPGSVETLVGILSRFLYAIRDGSLISCQADACSCDHNVFTVRMDTDPVSISGQDGCIYATLDRSGRLRF